MTDDETAMLLLQFFEALEQFELLGEAATLLLLDLSDAPVFFPNSEKEVIAVTHFTPQ